MNNETHTLHRNMILFIACLKGENYMTVRTIQESVRHMLLKLTSWGAWSLTTNIAFLLFFVSMIIIIIIYNVCWKKRKIKQKKEEYAQNKCLISQCQYQVPWNLIMIFVSEVFVRRHTCMWATPLKLHDRF